MSWIKCIHVEADGWNSNSVIVDMNAQTDVSVIGHCIKNTSLFLFLSLLIDLSFYLLVYH